MAKFHLLTVNNITSPTKESVAVTFDVPKSLKNTFKFTQGQHLTLKKDINGEDIRRSYSICSSPLDKELTVVIKKLEKGKFSTYANDQLAIKEKMEVMPPHGHFFVPLDKKNQNIYVAFACGSGITPIISIIETTLRTEPKSDFILFYGNCKTAKIIFHEKLEALKNQFMNRFSLYHILSQEKQETDLFNGRIDEEKIISFAQLFFDPHLVDHYFTCGPEQMMLTVKEQLRKLGITDERIHLELFTSPIGKLGTEKKAVEHKFSHAQIVVVIDGKSMIFPYNSDESILNVAFQNGIDLPYACKGGVCSTCVARLEEGEVEMGVNYALEPDELKRNLVLTCQARPKTNKVKLTFDV